MHVIRIAHLILQIDDRSKWRIHMESVNIYSVAMEALERTVTENDK